MELSQPDLSQRDDTPCFLVENSQLETQAEGDCSDGEEIIFRHKMLGKLAALRDSSTSPIMEVEMLANGRKCHITMATGGPGQQGGSQHPGASGSQSAGPSGSSGQGGGAEDDGNGGAGQGGGGGGDAGGGGDGDGNGDDDNEEEGEGDDSHHEEEAETSTSTSTPQSSGNSSGSRSSLPGLVRPIPSIVTPIKVIPVHEIQESEGDMSALSETEGRHEVDPGSESEGLGGLSEASTALVTDSEMSPARKNVPPLTSPGPSKLSGSSSSSSVQLQSSTISTISSFTSSSSGSSHIETPLKKSPRKTPVKKSPRKDVQYLSEAQAVKTSPLKGKTKSPKKSPHKSPRKAGQAKESPMKARRRLGEEELLAARDGDTLPEDTKQEGGTSGSSGASNKIHEHTSGEVRMEVHATMEDQPSSIPDSQPTGRPDSPNPMSSQQDMFVEDIQRPQEERVLSTPAENLGCLQLSGEPMLVQDTSLSSEGGSETVIAPSPEAYGPTPHIIPSSPTGETQEQDHPVEVAEDPVPSSQGSSQGSSHPAAQSEQELVDHPWQPSEPQWSQDLLASGPDDDEPSGKSAEMIKDSSSRPPSLHLQLPDTELTLDRDESTPQGGNNKGNIAVPAEQTKAGELQSNQTECSSSSGSQTGGKSDRKELEQALDFLKGMFPSLEKDILISVYEAQNCALEATIEQLLEMSQGSGAIGVSVEMREEKPESVTVRVQSLGKPEDVMKTSRGNNVLKKKVSLWDMASTSKDDPQTSYSQVEMIEEDADQEKEVVRKSEDDGKQVRTEDAPVQEGDDRSLQREGNADEQEEGSDVQDNWALHFTPSMDGSQSQNMQNRVREIVGDLDQSMEPELAPSQLLFLPQGQVINQPEGPAPTEHSNEEAEDVVVIDISSQKEEKAEKGLDEEKKPDILAAEKDDKGDDDVRAALREDSSVEVVLCDTEKEEPQEEIRATPSAQANSESSVPFHLALPKDGGLFRPIATTPPLMKAKRPRLPRHSTPLPDYTESPTDTTPTSAVTSAVTTPEGDGSAFADPGSSGGQGLTTAINRGGQPGAGPPLQMRMEAVLESQSDHTQEENQPPLFQLQKPPELDADQLKAIKESPSKLPSLFTRVREKVRAQQEEQDSSSEEDDAPRPADSEDLFEPSVSSRKTEKKGKGHKRRPARLLDSEESEMSVGKTEGHLYREEESKISPAEVMDVEEEVKVQHTCGSLLEKTEKPGVKAEAQEEVPVETDASAEREQPPDNSSEEKEEPIQALTKSQSVSSNADTLEYWRGSEEGEQLVPGQQGPDESGQRGQRQDEGRDEHAQLTKKRKRSPTTAGAVAAPNTAEKDKRSAVTEDPQTPVKLPTEEKDPYEYSSQVSPIQDKRKRRQVVAAGLGSPPASIPTWRGPSTLTASSTRVVGVQANTQPSPTKTLRTKKKDKQHKSAKVRAHGGGASPSGRGSTPSSQGTSREQGEPTGGDGVEEKEDGGEGERMPRDGDGEEGQPPRKRVKIDEEHDTESAGGEEESPPQYVRETTITTITETIVKRVITEKIKRGQKIVDYQVIEEMEEPVVDIEEEVSISPSISRTGSSLMSGELADISSLSTSASKSSPSSLSKSLSSSSLSRTNSSGPSMASLERTSSSQSKSSSSSPSAGGGDTPHGGGGDTPQGGGGDKDQEGFTKPVGSPRRRRSGIGSQLLGQQSKGTSSSQRLEVSETGTQTEVAESSETKGVEDKAEGGEGIQPEGEKKGEEKQQSRRRKSSRKRQSETVSPEEPRRETDSFRRMSRSSQAAASTSAVQKRSASTEGDTGRRSRTRSAGPSGEDSGKTAEEDLAEAGAAAQPKESPRGRKPRGRTRGTPRGRGKRGGASAGSRSLSTDRVTKTAQGLKESRSSSAARSSRSSKGEESDEQSSDSSEERAGTPEIPYQGVQQRLSGRSEKPQEETTRETVSSDGSSSEPREGARVMALLVSDKHWYPGVILKTLKNDRYLVRFEDEDERSVRPREIAARNMMVVSRLPVNTAVLAGVEDVQECVYAPGIIRGYHHSGEAEEYLVEFNDGSTVRAPHANVILNPEQAAAYRAQVMRVAEVSASVSLDNLVTGKRKRPGAAMEYKTPDKGRAIRDPEYSSGGTSSSVTTPRGPQAKRRRRMEEVGEMDTGTGQTPKPSTSSPVRGVPTLPAGIMDSPRTQSARRSLRSQEDLEELGPLPTNRRLLRGCAFILTAAPKGKAERASAAAESQSSEDSEEEVSTLPYSKSHVQRQIEQGGGKVYEDFKRMQERSKSTHLYLIADSFCRTKKYFLSLAHGIPCVSHQWIRDSCSQGCLQDYKAYLLPAGRSLETRNTIEWQPRGRIFQNMGALVVSESKDFRDVWADILVAAGCVMAKKVSKEEAESSPLDCDLVVSDPSCPGSLVQRAGQLGVKVVSTEWVIQCLIHAHRVGYTGHAKYRHDFKDT